MKSPGSPITFLHRNCVAVGCNGEHDYFPVMASLHLGSLSHEPRSRACVPARAGSPPTTAAEAEQAEPADASMALAERMMECQCNQRISHTPRFLSETQKHIALVLSDLSANYLISFRCWPPEAFGSSDNSRAARPLLQRMCKRSCLLLTSAGLPAAKPGTE